MRCGVRGAVFVLAALLMANPVLAKDGHGKYKHETAEREDHGHRSREHGHGKKTERGQPQRNMIIQQDDRAIILAYLNDGHARKSCPPGLAKKHNGCLPPGQAKKYRIGRTLPKGVVLESVPPEILLRLHPPFGHSYAVIDGDVVLIAEATKKIIDAVTLLSAVR